MKKIDRESYYPCRGIFRKTGQVVEFDSFESGVVIIGDEWLKSLEILPKGTEIKITF